ncbi:site-2 protease family protein [Candidatus Saccharibacteria bacterium]|nr:site-2 protease family protein [Candidatus Saccharibacteria bacterium]
MSIPLIILGFILFVGLVVLHELGHFLVARRNGVEVEEFGIGFPPRAKVLGKKDGTVYTLNWLPLGGFVKLKGEHDADTAKGTFGAASLWAKVKIMLAGVVVNALTAFVLLTILAAVGMPKILENQFTVESDTKIIQREVLVGYVEPNSPAQKAGIRDQTELAAIGMPNAPKDFITSADQLPELTRKYAGKEVEIVVRDGNEARQLQTTLRTTEEVDASRKEAEDTNDPEKAKGYLGIQPAEYIVQRSTWSSPVIAAGLIKQITGATFKGLGTALSGLFQGDTEKASSQVSGIVGISYIIGKGSALGLQFILLIIAIISLTLAIMNVLPIPALDGGRLFVTLLFRAIRKPLTQRKEEWIHGTGFILLMLLFVLITIVDINRFT